MKRVSRTASFLFLLCLVSVWAIPIKKINSKDRKNVTAKPKEQSQLHEQEKELEDLAKLQKDNADNVVFQTSKDVKVVQENGKKQKMVKTSKNVVNADNGDVLSSVRKTVKSENKGNESPKVSAITKVDIPSEGIHNTFIDDEEEEEYGPFNSVAEKKNIPSIMSGGESEDSNLDEDIKDLQKSASVMATYLLETGNFERFEDALQDIVKIGLMTVSEANEYEKIVLDQYERLMALEKAEELRAKVSQAPLDYAGRDYEIPYQVNNGAERSEMEEDSMNVKRYMNSQRRTLPMPRRTYTGADYTDYSDPMQSYTEYEPQELESAEDQESNEWLNRLLEQANIAGYPEERQSYGNARRNSPLEQERIRNIVQNILDSEPLSRGYTSGMSSSSSGEELESEGERGEQDGEEERNEEEDEMMAPESESEEEEEEKDEGEVQKEEKANANQSEEPVFALKALAKLNKSSAKRTATKSPTKHQAKKQNVAPTDKKKKKKST